MALTQGGALPDVTNTQTTTQNAPSWYNDYLQNLATSSQAASNAQFVGPTGMQQQGWDLAKANVGNYQPSLNAGIDYTKGAVAGSDLAAAQPLISKGTQTAPSVIQDYMNPYTTNVVNEIGRLGQQNIERNLAPQTTSGLVGSGQFGSTRGAGVLGQTIQSALQDVGGRQGSALASGYQQSMQNAQADLARQLQGGQITGQLSAWDLDRQMRGGAQMGDLAKTTQSLGLNDVNALTTMGEQQRQIEQQRQLFPLQLAAQQANIFQGKSIPTSTTVTTTGPQPGAYANSPLSNIAGIGSLIGGISKTPFGSMIGGGLSDWWNSRGGDGATTEDWQNFMDRGQIPAGSLMQGDYTSSGGAE